MKKLLILFFAILSILSYGQRNFYYQLADSAYQLTFDQVVYDYDPSYFSIDYPNGDVPSDRGVCTDVVIRAYRMFGIDLQKEVHEDMKKNFDEYPKIWGLNKPDKNIDHRRVPNLMVFFAKFGEDLELSRNAVDYKPGDIVCWNLGGGTTHIGIVSNQKVMGTDRYKIIHNIGAGQVLEDCLFDFRIIGHYRFYKPGF